MKKKKKKEHCTVLHLYYESTTVVHQAAKLTLVVLLTNCDSFWELSGEILQYRVRKTPKDKVCRKTHSHTHIPPTHTHFDALTHARCCKLAESPPSVLCAAARESASFLNCHLPCDSYGAFMSRSEYLTRRTLHHCVLISMFIDLRQT